MKKTITCIFCSLLFSYGMNAQILPGCTELESVLEFDDKNYVEYIPVEYTGDIWAMPMLTDDRLIIFVHGLSGQGDDAGGTEISWLKASTYTGAEYKAITRRPDYNDASIFDAAVELRDDIAVEYASDIDENTFIIAHSQGGIVSRRLDYGLEEESWGDRIFEGLVTFGTSHQGARILNNIEDFEPWLVSACEALPAGPTTELIETTFLLDLIDPLFIDVADITNYICEDLLPNRIKPILLGDDLEAPIGEDYEVNAPELNMLNLFTPEIPYVCFYGKETEPLMWNTLVHVQDGHLPNDYDVFEANNISDLTDYAIDAQLQYFAKYTEWSAEADYWSGLLD